MTFFNKKCLTIVAIGLTSTSAFSQSKYKNGVFLELGGNALLYSLNYERQFSGGFIGRIGIAYFTEDLVLPMTIGKTFGVRQHHLEVHLGIDLANANTTYYDVNGMLIREVRYNYVLVTGFIGYRYQKPDKRFFFRIGFTPIWRNVYSDDPANDIPRNVIPWGSLSVGYRF